MALRDGVDCVPEVAQEMPPVRDLDRLGCTLANAVGKDAGSVPGNDLDARVGLQPRGQALGPPVRQQVEHAVAFEVDQHRSVAVAAAPGPFVDRQHPHRRPRLRRGAGASCHAQQRIGADRHGQARGEAGTELAADSEAEMALQVAQPLGPPGGGRRGVGKPLGEGPPRTGRREAAEPARLNTQQHLAPLPGQVTKSAIVPAVNVRGWRGAGRAGGAGLTRRDDDGEMVGGRQDLLNQQPCRNKWRNVLEQEPGFGGNRDAVCAHSAPERPPAARGMRENL